MRKAIFLALVSGLLSSSITYADSSFYALNRTAQVNRRWCVQPIGWISDLSGNFKIVENKNPALGQNVDLERDTVNLDKESAFGVNCSYQTSHRATIEFNTLKVKHNGNLGVARMFKGKNYTANAKYKIDNNIYDVLLNYHLWRSMSCAGRENFYISGLFGVKVSDMDFDLEGQTITAGGIQARDQSSYSESLPTPYVGVEYGSFINKVFYFKAGVRYMGLNYGDYDGHHYDYNLKLSYRLSGDDCSHDVLMDVGYRYIVYQLDGKGNDVKLRYKGPYFGFDLLF